MPTKVHRLRIVLFLSLQLLTMMFGLHSGSVPVIQLRSLSRTHNGMSAWARGLHTDAEILSVSNRGLSLSRSADFVSLIGGYSQCESHILNEDSSLEKLNWMVNKWPSSLVEAHPFFLKTMSSAKHWPASNYTICIAILLESRLNTWHPLVNNGWVKRTPSIGKCQEAQTILGISRGEIENHEIRKTCLKTDFIATEILEGSLFLCKGIPTSNKKL